MALSRELTDIAMELAQSCWQFNKPVRLLALTAEQLVPIEEDAPQLSLFDTGTDNARQGRLEDAMSAIRTRYGKSAIQLGSFLGNDLGLGGSGNKSEEDDAKKD